MSRIALVSAMHEELAAVLARTADEQKAVVAGREVWVGHWHGHEVVAGLPGVMECAVIGIPDERSGEAVKLVVVKKDPALTETQVLEHCRHNLTGYKMPRVVEFRAELPKTPVGKVLRRELRDKTPA